MTESCPLCNPDARALATQSRRDHAKRVYLAWLHRLTAVIASVFGCTIAAIFQHALTGRGGTTLMELAGVGVLLAGSLTPATVAAYDRMDRLDDRA